MKTTIIYRNVQLIYDRDHGQANEGWYTRHDEYVADEYAEEGETERLLNGACDNGLDCTDAADVDTALDEAVSYYAGAVAREDIEVID